MAQKAVHVLKAGYANFLMEVFPNAPAIEAVISIRATLPDEVSADSFEELHSSILGDFPEKKARHNYKHFLKLKLGKTPSPTQSSAEDIHEGFWFYSQDKTRIFQARIDGFAYNKLKPYENWDSLSSEAKKCWEIYKEFSHPLNVTKLSLRYINRIEIPLPVEDLRAYCTLFPELPPEMPQTLSNFLMKIVLPKQEHYTSNAILNLTLDKIAPHSKFLPIIFDIDVSESFDILKPDTEGIWHKLSSMRDYKNLVFASVLTDKAKNLFR